MSMQTNAFSIRGNGRFVGSSPRLAKVRAGGWSLKKS